MIIMIVGHQHNIDGGKVFKRMPGSLYRLGPPMIPDCNVRPYRVSENIDSVHLYEEGGVTDRCYVEPALRGAMTGVVQARTRSLRPFRPIGAQNPLPNHMWATFCRLARRKDEL